MPTGGGKSVTYQVPAMAMEGVCVVITPLIALMKDQTDALKRKGILAAAIHSGMSPRQVDIALDNCVYGDYKFLYISPERIDSQMFRARFGKMKVSLIAVDEAHCISQWGYDFRPSYLKISRLREIAPDIPVLALTASATTEVVGDIMDRLGFPEPNIKRISFARPNLSYLVRETENKPEHLMRVINNVAGSGIIYVRTREKCEKLADFLTENGVSADFYHGGMGYASRSLKQDNWLKGKTRIMVATNAFGMGIDKPDVRFVVHFDLADSIETYYQEAGRAGRDGRPAYAVLLLSAKDKMNARKRIDLDFPPADTIRRIYEAIFNHYQIGVGSGKEQVREFNVFEFCSKNRMFIPMVINSLGILQLNGYLMFTDEADHPPRVKFTVSRDDLYKIRIDKQELDYFITVLLRSYTGIFSEFVTVNLNELAYASGYTLDKIGDLFKRLWQLRVLNYIPGSRSSLLIFTEERLPLRDLRISQESYTLRKETAAKRLESMSSYAENRTECRSLVIQRYFGEDTNAQCGKCDVCRGRDGRGKNSSHTIRERVLELLNDEERDLHGLVSQIGGDVNAVLEEIKQLTAEGKIMQSHNRLRLTKN